MSCTTLLVGKNASYDGSTIIARNEDSGAGSYSSKKFIVVKPENQPRKYKSVISGVEIDLPDNPMRYTCMPNAYDDEGIWGAAGVNSENIAMTATETITTNQRVQGVDPLCTDPKTGKPVGIGEEDLVTLTLPYIHSAKEGVERLGMLHETYGTYEMNCIAFSDVNEIWCFETIGGHHWMARRVPDDAYVVMPNQLGSDEFDFEDAYGEQKEFMCSKDLKEFVDKNHLDLSMDGEFNPRDAFGSHSDSDHTYNTSRAWWMLRTLNPRSFEWDGENAEYRYDDDDLPWCLVPEKKITIEDVKYVLSGHYQGTPFDCYATGEKKLRPIGINRNNFLSIHQLRPYKNDRVMSIEWIAYGSNVFNAIVPFFTNVEDTPAYFKDTTDKVTTDSFYWVNRLIGALADANYKECANYIERYQLKVESLGHHFIEITDNNANLEAVNQKISDMVQKETDDLLSKVLKERSDHMLNGFSRSDA